MDPFSAGLQSSAKALSRGVRERERDRKPGRERETEAIIDQGRCVPLC